MPDLPDTPNQPAPQPTPQPVAPLKQVDLTQQLFSKKTKNIGTKPSSSPQEVLDLVLNKAADDIIPWEDVYLPSRGVYYKGKIPDGLVQVRAMGLFADKILATQRLAKSGKSLDWLYKKCVRLPTGELDPLDLLANDRTFLLYYLRGITHGNEYDFMAECTSADCGLMTEQTYDLNRLASTVKGPNTSLGHEPFKVVLPYLTEATGQEFWVKVKFLRGRDVWAMLQLRTQEKGKNKRQQKPRSSQLQRKSAPSNDSIMPSLDDTLEQNLNLVIVEAMGSQDSAKISGLVERMHSRDTATIREFLRENTPGIETTVTLECEHCDEEMSIDLPITDSFFRPKRLGGPGAGMA